MNDYLVNLNGFLLRVWRETQECLCSPVFPRNKTLERHRPNKCYLFVFIHYISLFSSKLSNTGCFFGTWRRKGTDEGEGIWVWSPGFLEKDTNKTRAGRNLILELLLILMNIGPIDTIHTANSWKCNPVLQILTVHRKHLVTAFMMFHPTKITTFVSLSQSKGYFSSSREQQ